MDIYNTSNYRKIYETNFGPIPKDEYGHSYHIHHKDGNHQNNDPLNLIALSAQEHYDVHYEQGDFWACHRMAPQLGKSNAEIKKLAKIANQEKLKNGTHHLQKPNFQRDNALKSLEKGTHVFLRNDYQSFYANQRVKNGTHHFLNPEDVTCPHCNKTGQKFAMKRWHFDNCKLK
jgi:hypothetical protein